MKKDDFLEPKKIELPKHNFTNKEESKAWYDPYKKNVNSSLKNNRKVSTHGFGRGIDEIRDTENDIKEKENELKETKNNTKNKKRNLIITSSIVSLLLVFDLIIPGLSYFETFGAESINFIRQLGIISYVASFASIIPLGSLILKYGNSYNKELIIEKQIGDLKDNLEHQKNRRKAKEYIKNMSSRDKKIINELSQNPELKDPKKAFDMTYEEFLKLYEETNTLKSNESEKGLALIDDTTGDIALEKDFDALEEKSKTKRKRYKIKERKFKEQ